MALQIRTGIIGLLLTVGAAWGQMSTNSTSSPAQPNTGEAATPAAVDEPGWSYSVSAYTYLVPDGREYVQPTVTVDRGWMHAELRYNYEALDTGSAWLGYNFAGGDEISWRVTPMLGGVFGEMSGVAPGYKASVAWWKLELYSEGEYMINTDDADDSFFYNWSELTVSPWKWLRAGLVTQRTRLYENDRDVQRGFLLGVYFRRVSVTSYVFNPDDSRPTWVFAAGLGL